MKRKLLVMSGIISLALFAACGGMAESEISTAETSIENSISTEMSISEVEEENVSVSESEAEEYDFSIKDFYEEYGMYAGTCVSGAMLADPEQVNIMLSQFNSITPGNSMKPDAILNMEKSIETGNLVVEFGDELIDILNFAKENDLKVRGHALIWYSQTPDWIFYSDFKNPDKLAGRAVMLARMESMIKQVFEILAEKEYSDLLYAYDIVNEAIIEDGSLRDCLWLNTIGTDYVNQAFSFARKYAPENVELYYNDYNAIYKKELLVDFAETLKDSGGNYVFDGFGIQSHLYTRDSLSDYFMALDALSARGIKLQITELDIALGAYKNPLEPTRKNLKKQGNMYYSVIDGILERITTDSININSLTYWGFCDSSSWRSAYYPSLYDENLEPKFAYYGAMGARKLAGYDFDN